MDRQRGALAGLHVLLADDNRDARTIFSEILRYYGALVTTAASAKATLRVLRQIAVDVVVAEMTLPDFDGAKLLARARRRGVTVPFIALSSQDFDEHTLTAQGFVVYLRKPVDTPQLVNAVLAAARRS